MEHLIQCQGQACGGRASEPLMTHVLVTCTVSMSWTDLGVHIGIAEWHPIPPMQPGSLRGGGGPYDCICYFSAGMRQCETVVYAMHIWLPGFAFTTWRPCIVSCKRNS